MKLPRRQFLHLAASAAALPAILRVAWAQAYPTRPVRLIAPFAPADAAFHSINSSARSRNDSGIASPSALADKNWQRARCRPRRFY
jgi:hypothetical protein